MEFEHDVICIRKSKLLCLGLSNGNISLADPRTFKSEHTLVAHSAAISDMDVRDNTLITCGYSCRYFI